MVSVMRLATYSSFFCSILALLGPMIYYYIHLTLMNSNIINWPFFEALALISMLSTFFYALSLVMIGDGVYRGGEKFGANSAYPAGTSVIISGIPTGTFALVLAINFVPMIFLRKINKMILLATNNCARSFLFLKAMFLIPLALYFFKTRKKRGVLGCIGTILVVVNTCIAITLLRLYLWLLVSMGYILIGFSLYKQSNDFLLIHKQNCTH